MGFVDAFQLFLQPTLQVLFFVQRQFTGLFFSEFTFGVFCKSIFAIISKRTSSIGKFEMNFVKSLQQIQTCLHHGFDPIVPCQCPKRRVGSFKIPTTHGQKFGDTSSNRMGGFFFAVIKNRDARYYVGKKPQFLCKDKSCPMLDEDVDV